MTKQIPDIDLSRFPDANAQELPSPDTSIPPGIPDENLAQFPDAPIPKGSMSSNGDIGAMEVVHSQRRGRLGWWLLITVLAAAAFFIVQEIHLFLRYSSEAHPLYAWIGGSIISLLVVLIGIALWREIRGYLQLMTCQTLQRQYQKLVENPRDIALNREVQQLVKGYLKSLKRTARGELLVKLHRAETRMALADDALVWKEDLEQTVLATMDEHARHVIRQEAINVGLGTTISPSGFLDAAITLWRNVRLVRKIAELYQLRAGTYGTFRIVRETLAAVALADLSQEAWNAAVVPFGGVPFLARVGEGIFNAGFTVRIGLQAQRECRPIAFSAAQQQSAFSELMGVIGGVIRAATGWTLGERGKDKQARPGTTAGDPSLGS